MWQKLCALYTLFNYNLRSSTKYHAFDDKYGISHQQQIVKWIKMSEDKTHFVHFVHRKFETEILLLH